MTYPAVRANTLPEPAVNRVERKGPNWKHIVGIHVENQGDVAVVWLDLNTNGECTVDASYVFPRGTHFAVIADGIKERGEKPIAWNVADEDFVEQLRERGCKVLHDGYKETPGLCETTKRQMDERLNNGTFKVVHTNTAWIHEFENFGSDADGLVPQTGFPLMSATRHALHHLKKARSLEKRVKSKPVNFGGSLV